MISVDYFKQKPIFESWLSYRGTKTKLLAEGTQLWNAPKTSGDVIRVLDSSGEVIREYSVMLEAWEEITGESREEIAVCPNEECEGEDPEDLVGAHVLEYPQDKLRKGGEVLLIPLCRGCNSSGPDKTIILDRDITAVVLTGEGNRK